MIDILNTAILDMHLIRIYAFIYIQILDMYLFPYVCIYIYLFIVCVRNRDMNVQEMIVTSFQADLVEETLMALPLWCLQQALHSLTWRFFA